MSEPVTQEESEAGDAPRGSLFPGIWERRANESHPARRAFEVYLGMGDDRSLRMVAEEVHCHLCRVAAGAQAPPICRRSRRSCFQRPLSEPCMRFSRTRLSPASSPAPGENSPLRLGRAWVGAPSPLLGRLAQRALTSGAPCRA